MKGGANSANAIDWQSKDPDSIPTRAKKLFVHQVTLIIAQKIQLR